MALYHFSYTSPACAQQCRNCPGAPPTIITADGDMVCETCGVVAAERVAACSFRTERSRAEAPTGEQQQYQGTNERKVGTRRGENADYRRAHGPRQHPSVAACAERSTSTNLARQMRALVSKSDRRGQLLSRPLQGYSTLLRLSAPLCNNARVIVDIWARRDVPKFRRTAYTSAAALVLASRLDRSGTLALSPRLVAFVLSLEAVTLSRYVKKMRSEVAKAGVVAPSACEVSVAMRWRESIASMAANTDVLACLRGLLRAAAKSVADTALPKPLAPDAKAAALLWIASVLADDNTVSPPREVLDHVASWPALMVAKRRLMRSNTFTVACYRDFERIGATLWSSRLRALSMPATDPFKKKNVKKDNKSCE